MRVLVTGGAGFIGSHYVRTMLSGGYPGFEDASVTVFDKLTYAGNLATLAPVAGGAAHMRPAVDPRGAARMSLRRRLIRRDERVARGRRASSRCDARRFPGHHVLVGPLRRRQLPARGRPPGRLAPVDGHLG